MNNTKNYLGIDLHKKFAYWHLINEDGDVLWQGKVATTEQETKSRLEKIQNYVSLENVVSAIESVESYGWYTDMLTSLGIGEVKLANPWKLRLIAENPLKNDKQDACIIAKYLKSDTLPESYLAPKEIRDLRELVRTRAFLVRIRTMEKIRIKSILSKHGLREHFADISGNKARDWLEKQDLAYNYKLEVETLLELISNLDTDILKYELEIKKQAGDYREIEILISLPGIAYIRGLTIFSEVGDFKRFPNPNKLAAYAGLIPRSYSSGGKERLGSITKRGPSALRDALVGAAQQANPSWGYLYDFYKKKEESNGTNSAKVALARKLLTISWHLIHKDELFEARPANKSIGSVDV